MLGMDSLKHPSGDQRRDAEGYALRDGDWRGRNEAPPCSVLRLTGRMPTPAHSSCTASEAIFPCPRTPDVCYGHVTHEAISMAMIGPGIAT